MPSPVFHHVALTIAFFFNPRPRLTKALTWTTLLMECTFPIVLVSGPAVASVYLLLGISFHLAISYFLGLNTFVWAWVATYPAILHVVSTGLPQVDMWLRWVPA